MVSYWAKLFIDPAFKVDHICWHSIIMNILRTRGLSAQHFWIPRFCSYMEQCIVNVKWITNAVKQRMRDQLIQKLAANIDISSNRHTCEIWKSTFRCEKYLRILPTKFRKADVYFRTTLIFNEKVESLAILTLNFKGSVFEGYCR